MSLQHMARMLNSRHFVAKYMCGKGLKAIIPRSIVFLLLETTLCWVKEQKIRFSSDRNGNSFWNIRLARNYRG